MECSCATCWPGTNNTRTTGARSGNCSKISGTAATPCPAGALLPFNIDAKLNGAYIAARVAIRQRQVSAIPSRSRRAPGRTPTAIRPAPAASWESPSATTASPTITRAAYPPSPIRRSSTRTSPSRPSSRARTNARLDLIRKTGGKVEGDSIQVKTQAPKAPKLEVWDDFGSPVETRGRERPALGTFRGEWKSQPRGRSGEAANQVTRTAAAKGAEAGIEFTGTGAIVVGPYLASGGTAEVYVDGKLDRKVDVRIRRARRQER